MTRRPRSALIAVLFLFLWIVPLTAAGSSAGLPAWGSEPSPNAGFPRNVLEGVDVVSAADAWAVGSFEADGFNHPRPLAERWNGTSGPRSRFRGATKASSSALPRARPATYGRSAATRTAARRSSPTGTEAI